MSSRRHFVRTLMGTGAALPMFRHDAMRQVVRATDRLTSGDPLAAAEDESYWTEIQRAFDADRTGGGTRRTRWAARCQRCRE